ncbi:MAG: hypothetical protein LBD01_02185 [Puniceicoccales bacterium]|jgi:hypothetical protein|nr:hypothetical protein [Puniceicoccales bacterium]
MHISAAYLASIFAVDASLFIALGLLVVILPVLALWFLYEQRKAGACSRRALCTTFSCIKCELIYSRCGIEKEASCPQCGYRNTRLKF